MTGDVNLTLIMLTALIGVASPGPSTLAIAGASMSGGRRRGLALASGVTCGSLFWSAAAALGMSAIMLANAWALEVMRWCGVAYLSWLAWKAGRSALRPGAASAPVAAAMGSGRAFGRGLALHLTNPKAILFFASLYSIGLPADAAPADAALVFACVGAQSAVVFHGYALLFSSRGAAAAYARARRWFDGLCAGFFAFAAFRIATARLS